MRPYLITLIVPGIIILLAVPLILEKVPRNRLYGFRTPHTLSSDEVWYHANKVSGWALLAAGALWIVLGQILPNMVAPPAAAYRYVLWSGMGGLGLALVISFWRVYRK